MIWLIHSLVYEYLPSPLVMLFTLLFVSPFVIASYPFQKPVFNYSWPHRTISIKFRMSLLDSLVATQKRHSTSRMHFQHQQALENEPQAQDETTHRNHSALHGTSPVEPQSLLPSSDAPQNHNSHLSDSEPEEEEEEESSEFDFAASAISFWNTHKLRIMNSIQSRLEKHRKKPRKFNYINPYFQGFLYYLYLVAPVFVLLAFFLICILITFRPPIPLTSAIRFWNLLLATIVAISCHELGHMLAAVGENCRVSFVGIALVKWSPVAFAHINPKDLYAPAEPSNNPPSTTPSNHSSSSTHMSPIETVPHSPTKQEPPISFPQSPTLLSSFLSSLSSLKSYFKRIKIFSAGIAHNMVYCIVVYLFISKGLCDRLMWEERQQVRIWHIDPSSPLADRYVTYTGLGGHHFPPLIVESVNGEPIRSVKEWHDALSRSVQQKYCVPSPEFRMLHYKHGDFCCPFPSYFPPSHNSQQTHISHETEQQLREMICVEHFQPFYPAESLEFQDSRTCINVRDLIKKEKCSEKPCSNFEYCMGLAEEKEVFSLGIRQDWAPPPTPSSSGDAKPTISSSSSGVKDIFMITTMDDLLSQVKVSDLHSKIPGISSESLVDFQGYLYLTILTNGIVGLSNALPMPQWDGHKILLEVFNFLVLHCHFSRSSLEPLLRWCQRFGYLMVALVVARFIFT